jgi:hypothetical protein
VQHEPTNICTVSAGRFTGADELVGPIHEQSGKIRCIDLDSFGGASRSAPAGDGVRDNPRHFGEDRFAGSGANCDTPFTDVVHCSHRTRLRGAFGAIRWHRRHWSVLFIVPNPVSQSERKLP